MRKHTSRRSVSKASPRVGRLALMGAIAVVSATLVSAPAMGVTFEDVRTNWVQGMRAYVGAPFRSLNPLADASHWAGFWKVPNPAPFGNLGTTDANWENYSLLTNGANTYINAPSASGTIFFRGGNFGHRVDPDGWGSRAWIDGDSNMFVGGEHFVQGDLTAHSRLFVHSTAHNADLMWHPVSDARTKANIADFKLGLSDLEKVHTVKYTYNGLAGTRKDGKEYIGVIAQELEKVLPFMVESIKLKLHDGDSASTDVKTINPSPFLFLLVNSVQELSKQNKQLTAQYAEQNQKLAEQNQKLSELAEQNKKLTALAEQNKLIMASICKGNPTESFCSQSVALAK